MLKLHPYLVIFVLRYIINILNKNVKMKNIPEELLNIITEKLVKEFNPKKVILFGSHAWGKPTEDSDIDLCVVIPSSNEPMVKRMRRAHYCLRDLDISKDIIVKTSTEIDEYKDVVASIERKILEEGKILYDRQ
jgi:uncharacterized protein